MARSTPTRHINLIATTGGSVHLLAAVGVVLLVSVLGISPTVAQTISTRAVEADRGASEEAYADTRDARRVLEVRIAAMRARIHAIEVALQQLPPAAGGQIVARGTGAPTAADSHPQEVLDLVAAASGDGSSPTPANRVSERLRHRDRALTAETPEDLTGLVDALAAETGKWAENGERDRRAMAQLELEADRLELMITGIEAELRAVRKRPGRLTYQP